jgi:dTDP-4-dehydrorhamnose 3,5-epimerase
VSQRFDFIETPLAGLVRVDRKPIVDNRGIFSRFFCAEEFKTIGFTEPIVQMNHSLTKQKGTIRGMHYQHPPCAETKIVTCMQGVILDVAVDIRKDSMTFLQWHAERLSADNRRSLYIPAGFAHGFQALTDDCELLYLHSERYAPNSEGALNALDPTLAIDWPVRVAEVSERDRNHSMLNPQFEGIVIT